MSKRQIAQGSNACQSVRIVCSQHQYGDAPHLLGLLSARRERPPRRAAEQRYERAALHSITSSARSRNDEGTLRPSAFAVLRLIVNWTLTGSWTGSSLGFVPRKTRSA